MTIVGPELQREAECAAVLRTLPQWFGVETALCMYARDSASMPTFAITEDDVVVGFVTLGEHFPVAWEIHCVAVRFDARGRGLGSRLLDHAEAWLAARGVRFLQVKTIAETSTSAAYAQTRAFYARRGFVPLEVFPTLWNPRHPALQCIKVLPSR